MEEELTIRKAVPKDIPSIRKVAQISWNNTYEGLIPHDIQNEFIKRAYSDESMSNRINFSIFLVAELKGNIVGFANFFQEKSRAELGAIYILPENQGSGSGSKLFNMGLKELPNVTELLVHVERGNESAYAFYIAKGFQFSKEFEEELFGHTLKTKQLAMKIQQSEIV
ncbi:GNAT family N-acetyltransferase [Evansella sp. LMS18]|uniref:GNAT family N-acetyltransferase n=1 Tax=Evansella sp. LMS18 TaxID=2924033 RepID=UPI0020D19EF8|nr:GNAT family N-acetyltransferase [Evansella sp. LMS18]UTR10674.1 GNAT family N-acetyltransferase [Evansella sp. LMS18]